MRRERGTGSVIQKRGKYRIRLRQNGKDVLDTRQFDSRPEAESAWAAMQRGKKPKLKRSRVPTLQEWAFTCMNGEYGASIQPETYDTNEGYRLRLIEGTKLGGKKLSHITKEDCQAFIQGLRATDRRKVEGKIITVERDPSPGYVRRIAAFVSKLFTLAIDEGLITETPMARIRLPKIPDRHNRILDPAELQPIIAGATRTDAMMLTAVLGGLRRTELCNLKWSNLDLKRNLIHVPGTKTDAAVRTVPLLGTVREALEKLPRKGEYVFGTAAGKRLSPDNVDRDFRLRRKELGIPEGTRLQDLRGTFLSLLIDQGTGIRTAMELMGHRDPRTTLRAYARGYDKSKLQALQGIEKTVRVQKRVRKPKASA